MNRRWVIALAAGLLLGTMGLLVSLTPLGFWLEEEVGLYLLFRVRGPRPVPPGIVIVSLNQGSAEYFGLPRNPQKWPRRYHAELTELLTPHKPSVVAFDILFSDPTTEADDERFARALRNAGNVVLCEYLGRETIPLHSMGYIHTEKTIAAIEPLAGSAALNAPFPLPKVPFTVTKFWTFKTGAACMPTLPVAAFQIHALPVYEEFRKLLETAAPDLDGSLPSGVENLRRERKLEWLIAHFRHIFEQDPTLPGRMTELIDRTFPGIDAARRRLIESLIGLYADPDTLFLNYYGPAGTIPTIPLHRVIQPDPVDRVELDFRGKAVFVGLAETSRPEQRDGFHTVFSSQEGTDLSGVEIAATAFANLLEGKPLRQLPPGLLFGLIFLFGMLLTTLALALREIASACAVAALATVYMLAAGYSFAVNNLWIPVGIPLFIQLPLLVLVGFGWHYSQSRREREDVRKAFGFFLPQGVIDQIIRNMSAVRGVSHSRQAVFGTVLCSDGEQYARLAETMNPVELNNFLNRYYESIFHAVQSCGGTVSDVIGDSMLAVWATTHPDQSQRRNACRAALTLIKATEEFNERNKPHRLSTRIGLHYGELLLATVGGFGHYEYRPVGDVVNTASRIENLNKHFKTRLLVSASAIDGLQDFLAREIGYFLLAGKTRPVQVFELVCPMEERDEVQDHLVTIFSEGLREFESRRWGEASALFREYLRLAGSDQPASFYLNQCRIFRENPPGETWEGVIHLGKI